MPDKNNILTSRQLEVLKLVAEGDSMKMIAHKLEISPRTVGAHINRCKQRLGAFNTPNTIHLAHQLHIL